MVCRITCLRLHSGGSIEPRVEELEGKTSRDSQSLLCCPELGTTKEVAVKNMDL